MPRSLHAHLRHGDVDLPPFVLLHLILSLQRAGALEWNAPPHLCPQGKPTALDLLRPAGLATPCVRVALPLKNKDNVWSLTQFKSAGDRYTTTCGGYVRAALRRAYVLPIPYAWPRDRGRRAFIYLHVLLARAIRRPQPLLGPLDWANALLFRAGLYFTVWKNHYTTAKGTRHAEKRKARGPDAAAPPHPPACDTSSALLYASQHDAAEAVARDGARPAHRAARRPHRALRLTCAPRRARGLLLCSAFLRSARLLTRCPPGLVDEGGRQRHGERA